MLKEYPRSIVVIDDYKHQEDLIKWVESNCLGCKIIREQDAFKIYFTCDEDYTALLLRFR